MRAASQLPGKAGPLKWLVSLHLHVNQYYLTMMIKIYEDFFFTILIGKNRHAIGKKGGYFLLGMGPNLPPQI